MASGFKDVFGAMLVTELLDPTTAKLPSPNQLKRRLIIKHKKLPEGASDRELQAMLTSDDYDGQISYYNFFNLMILQGLSLIFYLLK